MIILREETVNESSANVRLTGKIADALNLEYQHIVSNVSDGEIPLEDIDKAVASTVSMAVDAVRTWVYLRMGSGQKVLVAKHSRRNEYSFDNSLNNKLIGMKMVLDKTKDAIVKWEK